MRGVIDPELGDDLVDLGMYQGCEIDGDGTVTVQVALTTAGCPLRTQLQRDVKARVGSLPGVDAASRSGRARWRPAQKKELMARARRRAQENPPATEIPGRTRVLAVSSGKGGVGKSSVTVNLAAGLAARGFTVGPARRRHRRVLGAPDARHGGTPGGHAGPMAAERPRIEPMIKPVGTGADQGGLHGLPFPRGRGDHVAGPDAAARRPALSRGSGLGRPRLPAGGHATRDGRHPDGAGPHAAAGRDAHRDHPGAGGPEGGRAGRRHGPQGLPAGGRRRSRT